MNIAEVYNDLENEEKEVIFGEEKIKVKQYLPLREKFKLVLNIIENSYTETGYKALLSYVSYNINMIEAYTDIDLEIDKSLFDVMDFFDENGLTEKILKAIPETEKDFIEKVLLEDLEERKKKEDSLINNLSKAFKDLAKDIDSLDEDLIEKAKEIMSSGITE